MIKRLILFLSTLIIVATIILISIIIYKNFFEKELKPSYIETIIKPLEKPLITYNQKETEKWYLVLVNRDNEIPSEYNFELAYTKTTGQFDSRAISYLENMITDARNSGVDAIWSQSTYRSIELQSTLYYNRIKEQMNYGYSEQEAIAIVEKLTLPPGTSEHNIALAVDFNTITYEFEYTEAYTWLQENAHKYGFILRYPEDKTDITNINYEPWHYRYVTEKHATKMKELDMCLEEYLEYLKG